ncbi:nodulation protein NfeD [Kroppenstedtia pulmonis]|uniref:Nodulation protein NfeD n=1 Tax=Kroppenstedtia pulmonis TaxID=1380685 RepID=A0A7D3Y5J6_9BACL|nr:nodulation protein NfeD [Kroppenstedtia pulmonis]QKG84945.1 nodulation protein NfeD [Kroppenstedtia pulmonis]
MRKAGLFLVGVWLLSLCFHFQPVAGAESAQKVYWIPVEQEVEQGLYQFLNRSFQEAEQAGAQEIILEMDTLGGEVNAALNIGKMIRQSRIPVTVYIKGEAISAGSYIALNAKHILMAPGSAMGAAEPRTISGEVADPKTLAFWKSNMRAAAESQNRDPEIAAGMVDRNMVIKGVKKKGELVSLSAKEAFHLKMADKLVQNEKEVLSYLDANPRDVHRVEMSWSEKLARFVTSPMVIPVLLTLGFIGIAIEMFTPGFGIPGLVGASAFGLYFFGHYLAGFAGGETAVLFTLGIVLMLIELFVPGFGIFGLLGLASLIAAVVVAAYDAAFSLASILVALAVTGVVLAVVLRRFGIRGIWRKLVLSETQQNEEGYTSRQKQSHLIGKQGKAVTPLRPAGVAVIDGIRRDVVSRGGLIPKGSLVEVVDTEGVRVVVRLAPHRNP